MCGAGKRPPRHVLRASRRPPPPASPGQINWSCSGGSTHPQRFVDPVARHFRGRAKSSASSSSWTSAPQRLEPQPGRPAAENRGADRADVPSSPVGANYVGEVAKRGATSTGPGDDRRHFLGQPAFCGRLPPGPGSPPRPARHLPLRRRRPRPPGPRCATALRRGTEGPDHRLLVQPPDRYSEERSQLTIRRAPVEMFQVAEPGSSGRRQVEADDVDRLPASTPRPSVAAPGRPTGPWPTARWSPAPPCGRPQPTGPASRRSATRSR